MMDEEEKDKEIVRLTAQIAGNVFIRSEKIR